VPPYEVKLCPACGYPLLLEHGEPAPDAEPHKLVYKPEAAVEELDRSGVRRPTPTMSYTGRQPTASPTPARATAGPHCPQCRTVNPVHRKRCEVCGYELWPGAASPPRWQPDPPAMPAPAPRRRNRWRWAVMLGAPAVVMAAVWVLALVL
jgi:hypothetical protein